MLLIIDGNGIAYRAYHALQQQHMTSEGKPTGAIIGFFNIAMGVVKTLKPRYVVVVFDPKGGADLRKEMYAGYKALREPQPDDMRPQMKYIQKIVPHFGWTLVCEPGYEADDAIASYARSYQGEVVILSKDKDFFQLVDDRVSVYHPDTKTRFFPADVREKFGVEPSQFRDYLSFLGDTSDCVPGIKGWGPVSASKYLAKFKTGKKVFANVDKLPKGLATKLENQLDNYKLARRLIKLYDVPDLPDATRPPPRNDVKLVAAFERIEAHAWVKNIKG